MTSHADTLRNLARDTPIGGMVAEHPNKSALLAGAAAIDTLTKVRAVLDRLTAHADDLEAHAQANASTGPRIEAAGIRTGWHQECQKRAQKAMTALGFDAPEIDPIPEDEDDWNL